MKKQFGKFENGVFIQAPKYLQDDKYSYFNPSAEIYKNAGYAEIVQAEIPEELRGKQIKSIYTQCDEYIIQSWELMTEDEITEQEQQAANTIENRIELLEEQMNFLMDYGKFKGHWQEHKYNKKVVS